MIMKTLDLMHKHGTPKTGNIYNSEYVFTPEQIESLINEVIAQRAGEPVAEILIGGEVYVYEEHRSLAAGTEFYLAADPSVIEYVKTLRKLLDNACDDHWLERSTVEECKRVDETLAYAPDSIKHQLD